MTESTPAEINNQTSITVRLGNLLALLGVLSIAVFGYAQITSRLTKIESDLMIDQGQIDMNSAFRQGWPIGALGRLPDDVEQDIRIQHLEQEIKTLRKASCNQSQ